MLEDLTFTALLLFSHLRISKANIRIRLRECQKNNIRHITSTDVCIVNKNLVMRCFFKPLLYVCRSIATETCSKKEYPFNIMHLQIKNPQIYRGKNCDRSIALFIAGTIIIFCS